MIFPNLEIEKIVQAGDKTRLSALKSFASPDEQPITLMEIDPDGSGTFIDVTLTKFLDWEYADAGTIDPVIRITTDGNPASKSYSLNVISEIDDNLWSHDADLVTHEPDIMKWVPDGRNTFNNIHRRSQELILAWLDKQGYVDIYKAKFTKSAIVNVSEVTEWSKFMTLRLIFEGITVTVGDIFDVKAKQYKGKEVDARERAVLRIDVDGDGVIDIFEDISVGNGSLVRR